MKRIILLWVVVLSVCMAQAKVIKYEDGFLGTNAEFKFSIETRNDSIFLLACIMSQDAKIREDAKMLIKFSDSTVAELKGTRKENGLFTTVSGSSSGANGFSYGSTSSTLWCYSVAEFPIDSATMKKFKTGIIKLRINTSPDVYTKEWNRDKIGKDLYAQYLGLTTNSFEENF